MLTAAKLVLPALVAALFVWGAAWCVVRTLRPQMADTAAVGGEPPRSSKAMAALAGLLFVCVLQLVFCHAAQANNPGVGLAQAMEWQFYGNTDARHYIDLAQYGYGTGGAFAEQELMIVFFPLFPALLRVVHLLVGGSYPLLGLAVQGPLFAGAAVSLYTLVSRRWGERQAVLTLALLMASPAAVFFAVPMTESLFLGPLCGAGCAGRVVPRPRRTAAGAGGAGTGGRMAPGKAARAGKYPGYAGPGGGAGAVLWAEPGCVWPLEPVQRVPVGALGPKTGPVYRYRALPFGLYGQLVGG